MKKKYTAIAAAAAVLAILALVPLVYGAVCDYSTSVPVMDYFPKSEWEFVTCRKVTAAGLLSPGYFTEPRPGFLIWYETADMKNYAPPVLRKIGFHTEPRQIIEPEKLQEVLGKYRFWYVDNEFHEPEFLFIISTPGRMWWLGASKGEYLILLPNGEQPILHFRDNGSLYRALMKLVEQSE